MASQLKCKAAFSGVRTAPVQTRVVRVSAQKQGASYMSYMQTFRECGLRGGRWSGQSLGGTRVRHTAG